MIVTRDQVVAFRLAGHHLDRRLEAGSLEQAAGACGIQNSPPGSASLGLHARVAGLGPDDIDNALEVDKTLLQVWSLRQSPLLVPTADAAVFTTALLPGDEESLRFFIQGYAPVLGDTGMNASEVVELVTAALHDALDGRVLTKREMGAELARRLPARLSPWFDPDRFSNFTAIFVRPIALTGLFCFAPRAGNEASFVRTDQWLGAAAPPPGDRDEARAELVRRYLRCYGPSTAAHFADWAGISPEQAGSCWALVEGELHQVGAGWVLADDLPRLDSTPVAAGVRLLPPYDQAANLRDREMLVPDRALHPKLWKKTGNPGLVLLDGRVVALWRPRKQGGRLIVAVESFVKLAPRARAEIEAEAAAIAAFRGATSAEVTFAD